MEDIKTIKLLLTLAITGAIVGLAKVLAKGEEMTFFMMLGRVMLGSCLAMVAGALLQFYPEMPLVALVGVSAGIAILGVDGIFEVIRKFR